MNIFNLEDTDLDDSPPSIAYATIALLSAVFDFEIVAQDGLIIITDGVGTVYTALDVGSSAMAELFVSVLMRAGEALSDQVETEDESDWMALQG